jgi:predicted RNA-binding protein YlqC (UPF0109 family)
VPSPVELVTSIVKSLVDKPENVEGRWLETEKTVEVNVLPEDRGKVIGKRGKTIDSLRILVSAVLLVPANESTLNFAKSNGRPGGAPD